MCKILHWATYSHSKHLALDQAYEDFAGLFDTYVEVALGIFGRESTYVTPVVNEIVSDEVIIAHVSEEFVKFNNELFRITSDYSQLQNVLDEIKAVENQLIYRLTQTA